MVQWMLPDVPLAGCINPEQKIATQTKQHAKGRQMALAKGRQLALFKERYMALAKGRQLALAKGRQKALAMEKGQRPMKQKLRRIII